jgi:hypothetical protein
MPTPSDESGPCCPLCGSNRLRIWELGKNIPDYYGRTPLDGAPEGGMQLMNIEDFMNWVKKRRSIPEAAPGGVGGGLFEERLSAVEKRIAVLEQAAPLTAAAAGSFSMDLLLPEGDIAGLHFNEQFVKVVFERKGDLWWRSKDVLFLSARNIAGNNATDTLTAYLQDRRIVSQIAAAISETEDAVEITLPSGDLAPKLYNGAPCDYWLADADYESAGRYVCLTAFGEAGRIAAMTVCGCVMDVRVRKEARC